ncbi:hypothetical protein [Nocardia cyriacigeorgica]|uniref:hypothetical protein n=1 Tax=Nocardia cyriacigeorgica TaxID=135487 RepID=UPI001894C46E|nr:hypothetical protein [Nocardia cyriacigeorgica]MBF6289406.1 hypothetical protein [Nocardia cyriacigeorgica]
MTGPYGPDLFPADDIPVNHDPPAPGTGFFRDELESMLTYHADCPPCAFKAVLLKILDSMNRQGVDFLRMPPRPTSRP